jgi:methylated-DNA-[protein]-cysteine S-methyltransferase
VLAPVAARLGPRVLASDAELRPVRDALSEYLEGGSGDGLAALDVDLTLVPSAFRRTVLETLRAEVGPGSTMFYGALGARVGHPKAARAVGTAMARNPRPHRRPVPPGPARLGRRGLLRGGPDRKRALLELEGALPRPL